MTKNVIMCLSTLQTNILHSMAGTFTVLNTVNALQPSFHTTYYIIIADY